ELKTHQRGPKVVLRSKQPEGVYQEAYGYLLTHYAIRALIHDAAVETGLDPDRLSFLRTLRVVRRSTSVPASSFSPLTTWRWPIGAPSLRLPALPSRFGVCVPTPASSSARCPTTVSSVLSTATGRNQRSDAPNACWRP